MIRVAYICEPQIGGTFSFFQHLRPVIGQFGVELLCVPPVSRSAIESSPFRGIEGIDAIELDEELPHATEQLIGHLQATGCAAVLTLPCCGVLSANLPRYLPLALPCAVRVPMMTRGAYMPTAAVAPWVDRIIAVSDRVASDLVGSYGIATGQVATIFNGVEPADFPARALNPAAAGPLRLVYSGRLSDLDKGVMLLPAALRHLRAEGESFEVTVAGDGPDREKLVRAFETAGVAGCVRMVGAVPHDRIRKLYYEADIFVFRGMSERGAGRDGGRLCRGRGWDQGLGGPDRRGRRLRPAVPGRGCAGSCGQDKDGGGRCGASGAPGPGRAGPGFGTIQYHGHGRAIRARVR